MSKIRHARNTLGKIRRIYIINGPKAVRRVSNTRSISRHWKWIHTLSTADGANEVGVNEVGANEVGANNANGLQPVVERYEISGRDGMGG